MGKVQIQRDEDSHFLLALRENHFVVLARKAFVHDGIGWISRLSKNRGVLFGQVLVDIEFQTLVSIGKAKTPSLVSSAAYINTASMSTLVSVG